MKNKNFNRCRKKLTKFNIYLWKKTFNKLSIEGAYHNIIKPIYDKSTVNIVLNDEMLKTFSLGSRTRQEHSHHPIQHGTGSLSQNNQAIKRN